MTDAAQVRMASTGAGHAAGEPRSGAPAVHAIRQSLVRPMLYLGVDRTVIAVEATLCLALVVGAGPRLPTVAVCAFVVLALHPTMAWLTSKDPLALDVYLRSRAYRDFYAPHAGVRRPARAVRPSVPPTR